MSPLCSMDALRTGKLSSNGIRIMVASITCSRRIKEDRKSIEKKALRANGMYCTLTLQLTHILFKSLDIPHNTRNLSLLSIPRCILPLLLVNIQSYGNKNLPFTSFFLGYLLVTRKSSRSTKNSSCAIFGGKQTLIHRVCSMGTCTKIDKGMEGGHQGKEDSENYNSNTTMSRTTTTLAQIHIQHQLRLIGWVFQYDPHKRTKVRSGPIEQHFKSLSINRIISSGQTLDRHAKEVQRQTFHLVCKQGQSQPVTKKSGAVGPN
uniref:Uncharacterized protein n=1 Tax=Salix viminalis TaxID=40686 RepID=A0A6N2KNP6_SALVM